MEMNKCLCRVCLVTHSGSSIGGGHIGRCSALAEELAGFGVSVFWLVNHEAVPALLKKGFSKEEIFPTENPFGVSQAKAIGSIEKIRPDLCVIDSYDAGEEFVRQTRNLSPVLVIDDNRPRPLEKECDILLNYNLGADGIGYSLEKARLLLGPEYTLLRKGFAELAPVKGEKVLVVSGASDMKNVGETFAGWWQPGWPSGELVLGPLVGEEQYLKVLSSAATQKNLSVLRDPPDLPERMAKAGLVICTSSVTSYEVLSLRKPMAVFQVAVNQNRIGEETQRQGLGVNLGKWGSFGPRELEGLFRNPPPSPPRAVNPGGAAKTANEIIRWIEGRRCSV